MWLSFVIYEYLRLSKKRFFTESFYSTLVFIDLDIMSLHFWGKCAYQELSSFKKNSGEIFSDVAYLSFLSHMSEKHLLLQTYMEPVYFVFA